MDFGWFWFWLHGDFVDQREGAPLQWRRRGEDIVCVWAFSSAAAERLAGATGSRAALSSHDHRSAGCFKSCRKKCVSVSELAGMADVTS